MRHFVSSGRCTAELIVSCITPKRQGQIAPVGHLSRRIQHVFDENAVPPCRVIYENMGHGANQLAVLNDRTTGHEGLSLGTTLGENYLTVTLYFFVKSNLDEIILL